jgi:hypothetical protein
MRSLSNLGNLRFCSPTARKAMFGLFLISLVMDADMLFSPMLISHGIIQPHAWDNGTHIVIGIIEAALMVGGTVLWLSMLYICMRYSGRGVVRRVLWALAFCFGIWFTAQFYYLFPYRRYAMLPDSGGPGPNDR